MIKTSGSLKWWLLQSVVILASLYCYHLGLFHLLWIADLSKISWGILVIFSAVSIFIGYMTRKAEVAVRTGTEACEEFAKDFGTFIPPCRFSAELMAELGMLGTVIGFILTLGPAFEGFDVAKVGAEMIVKMALGMSTALVTTLVGMVCSMLTRMQLVNMEMVLDAEETQIPSDVQ